MRVDDENRYRIIAPHDELERKITDILRQHSRETLFMPDLIRLLEKAYENFAPEEHPRGIEVREALWRLIHKGIIPLTSDRHLELQSKTPGDN